jgi:phosphatidate cytidylyltransferase
MFRTRLISGILAVSLVIGILTLANDGMMRCFLALLVGLASWEMASMIFPKIHRTFGQEATPYPVGIVWWATLATPLLFLSVISWEGVRFQILALGLIIYLLLGVFSAKEPPLAFGLGAGLVVILVYGILPWVAIWELYRTAPDARYIYFLGAIVSTGDTAAYFAGKAFGRHKLAPHFSPNKTVEGSLGGLLAGFLGGAVVKFIYGSSFLEWWVVGLASLIVGVLGQIGDLTESAIKRFAGVKDSGAIMPGHGGLLDRLDGILMAAPGLWLILECVHWLAKD